MLVAGKLDSGHRTAYAPTRCYATIEQKSAEIGLTVSTDPCYHGSTVNKKARTDEVLARLFAPTVTDPEPLKPGAFYAALVKCMGVLYVRVYTYARIASAI